MSCDYYNGVFQGNLKNYLIQHRQDVDALIESNRLVQFALDAASGLACLHRHEYVHKYAKLFSLSWCGSDINLRSFVI